MSGRIGIVLLVLAGVLALVGSSAFYTVNQSQHAILLRFGSPVRADVGPGLHLKWPMVHTVQKYDNRLRVFETTAIEQTLGDQKTVILQGYLCWRIADPLRFYESVRYVPAAEQKLNDIAFSALGSHISKYPIGAIISTEKGRVQLPEIEQQMKKYMAGRLKDEYGICLERFGINRLALPPKNEEAVYRRMTTKRNEAAEAYRTQGRQRADEIRATARKAAEKTLTDAKKYATMTRGAGEAKAARTYADAYTADPDFYNFWRTLQTYRKVFGPETTLVIPSDSELLKYFRTSEVERVVDKTAENFRTREKDAP